MAIFNWFGKKPEENEQLIPEIVETTQEQSSNESDSPQQDDDEKKNLITITWGTGMPIDVIYNFIHKNFEEEGYQDALVDSDVTYRDAKIAIIRTDLQMLFKRIALRYHKDIREAEAQIENAKKAYAFTSAASLEVCCETYKEHLDEIKEMQDLLESNDPKMTTLIESYRRGFLKGIAAVTANFINNK